MGFDQAPAPEGRIFNKAECESRLNQVTTLQELYEVLRSYQYVVNSHGEIVEVSPLIKNLERVAMAILALNSEEEFREQYAVYRKAITDNGKIFTNFLRLLREMSGRTLEKPSAGEAQQ